MQLKQRNWDKYSVFKTAPIKDVSKALSSAKIF